MWQPTFDQPAATLCILAAIAEDISAGVIPFDVPDYSALHEFVDANEYLHPLLEEDSYDPGSSEQATWLSDVTDAVDTAIKASPWVCGASEGEDFRMWVWNAKARLMTTRAAYFGVTVEKQAAHDNTTAALAGA